MSYRIDKVGIVGAGTMGGGIAAHLANIGIPVVLLDIVPPDLSEAEKNKPAARNRIVNSLYDRMVKARPANLARADRGELITLGNLEDDFDKLADCDWIIEVIIEQLEPKQALMARLEQIRGGSLADGPHTLHLRAEDSVGNVSAPFSLSFILDTLGPAVTVDRPTSNQTVNAPVSVAGRVTDAGGTASLEIQTDGGAFAPVSLDAGGNFAVDLGSLVDGPHTVGLRAGRAYRRPLAAVQYAELDATEVGGSRHGAAQGIDFLDQVALADATDGRVTAHLPEGFHVVGQQQGLHAHACCSERGFGAGRREERHVARHHHDLEGSAEVERRQVVADPFDVGGESLRRREHRRIGVDSDDLDAPMGELDRDATRAASRVEHGRRSEPHDERDLAVHVLAGRPLTWPPG